MKTKPRRLLLSVRQSPGDVLAATQAIESLHLTYPGEFLTGYVGTAPELLWHNPRIVELGGVDSSGAAVEAIELHYPAVHESDRRGITFGGAYCEALAAAIGRPVPLRVNRPQLYLSEQETGWLDQVAEQLGGRQVPFWLVNAGVKTDYPTKGWPVEHFQRLVELTAGRVQWVQVGAAEHAHPKLRGVLDLVGQTDLRQLVRLAWHCRGAVGGVSFLMHLAAAWQKPYVALAGGREPVAWNAYPTGHYLHAIGSLDCCRAAACWKSRVVPLGDGDAKDSDLCTQPIVGLQRPAARCLALISPAEVAAIVERYTCRES